jgi:hypothetical protein
VQEYLVGKWYYQGGRGVSEFAFTFRQFSRIGGTYGMVGDVYMKREDSLPLAHPFQEKGHTTSRTLHKSIMHRTYRKGSVGIKARMFVGSAHLLTSWRMLMFAINCFQKLHQQKQKDT